MLSDHLSLSHGALLFVGHSNLVCSLLLMFRVLSSLTAEGKRPDALPQAAERSDRPGLSQTQTGQETKTFSNYVKKDFILSVFHLVH